MKLPCALVLLLVCGGMTGPALAAERPNILIIVSEDNGPELSCYGEPSVRTPVLDQLAAEGVRFERAFVPQAGCSQSRAAYLTGLFPHQNGQFGLATWKFQLYRDQTPNIVSSLKSQGYRTGLIGKLHVNPESAFPFDLHEIPQANFQRRDLGRYAAIAEEFFNQGEQPFLLSVNYPDAHRPFHRQIDGLPEQPRRADDVAPLRYSGLDTAELREDTANLYNCMMRLDSHIGDLLAALERSGKAERTLVIYFGDHGADLMRGKRTCYEGGLRIPLIVRWPGQFSPGQVREELVSTLDLYPTLLDAAGLPAREELAGSSLLPLLKGESTHWREHLFAEYHLHSAHDFFPQRSVRDARFKLIQNLLPDTVHPGYAHTLKTFYPKLKSALAEATPVIQTAYRRMRRPPEYELYDLQSDPTEFVNLADDPRYADKREELKQALAKWRQATHDPFLDESFLRLVQQEVQACFQNGKPDKSRLHLTYPDAYLKLNP